MLDHQPSPSGRYVLDIQPYAFEEHTPMCGIVGIFGAGSRDAGLATIERMNATIVHRGPDDAGAWANHDAAVAMRRLSIIDLAGGHQPMLTEDGIVIVFNGEIYNYRALREELQTLGYGFKTTSDTEVILNLYHHGGIVALERLDGMFGICIVDPRRGEAYLIRDRLGIKPLYFGSHAGRFYFASEIKAIVAGLPSSPPPNAEAIYHYLSLRFVPGPATVWQGVYKLPPGHRLRYRLRDHTWDIETYWRIGFHSAVPEAGRNYEQEFERLFLGAVESHMLASDVPVGTLLSGGLDSSAVTAATAELGIRGLHTFSVAFSDGGAYSELKYARATAQHIGTEHHEVVIGQQEFLDFLDDFVWYADEPLADLASIPLHYVSQLARRFVKVVLSGEGADEVLAGYDFERLAQRADRLRRRIGWLPRHAFGLAARLFRGQRAQTLRAMAQHGWSGYLRAWGAHMTWNWNEAEKNTLWRDGRFASTKELVRSWYDAVASMQPVDQMQQVSCGAWLVEDLLMKADKMTMANSLELRVPFLDHHVVEWAQTLPLRWKVGDRNSGYVSKRILREFARRRLPRSIIERPKQGFPVPAYEWLKGDLGEWAGQRLRQRGSRITEWIDVAGTEQTLVAARRGDMRAAHNVWNLIILDTWARRWL